MTADEVTGRRERSAAAHRVGLFGLLGCGNLGNDASMESVFSYLRADHPNAILDAMCMGPDTINDRYGIPTIHMRWYGKYEHRVSGVTAIALKVLGKGIDVLRTMSWVRRHDVIIVPGMGVLEATIPLRPWETPLALFLLCAFGRLFGTKVALVSVGASGINQPLTRWLLNLAARLAFYRSYRDISSRDTMRQRGVDTQRDHVYPDLVFGLPVPPHVTGDAQTVGVGVMGYFGTNDDRRQADQLHAAYVEKMKLFVRWLIDSGHKVRLFGGNTNGPDNAVVHEIMADVRGYRPDLDPACVVAEPVSSFTELMRTMTPAATVVATRYHNVVCALKLSKPTISLGYYAPKNMALMADAGLSAFCQSIDSLDVDLLIEQFKELERRSPQVRRAIMERNAVNARLLDQQFGELSAVLFSAATSACTSAKYERTPRGIG